MKLASKQLLALGLKPTEVIDLQDRAQREGVELRVLAQRILRAPRRHVWVVSTGSGYYAESVWTSEEAAWEEARRIGVAEDGPGRAVKRWELNAPSQIWPDAGL